MVMLTNVLRALVKNLKEEIIYEFYVNKVSFWSFNVLNTQYFKKNYVKQVPHIHLLASPLKLSIYLKYKK